MKSHQDKERGRVLREALKVINGERQDTYGKPEDSFQTIAEYWTTYLKAEGLLEGTQKIASPQVMIMMSLLKHARMSGQKPHRDNFMDAAGYLGIAGDTLPVEDAK